MFRRRQPSQASAQPQAMLAASREFFEQTTATLGHRTLSFSRGYCRTSFDFSPLKIAVRRDDLRVYTTELADAKLLTAWFAPQGCRQSIYGLRIDPVDTATPSIAINQAGTARVGVPGERTSDDTNLWTPHPATTQLAEMQSQVSHTHMIGRWEQDSAGSFVVAPFAYFSLGAQAVIRDKFAAAIEQLPLRPVADSPPQ
jgi:hypothetical protein